MGGMAIMTEQKAIWAALAVAQGNFLTLKPTGKATISGSKASYSYDYATLGDIHKATREALLSAGLVVTMAPVETEKGVAVECTIAHAETGEMITQRCPVITGGGDMKALGSGISYARRYLLLSMLDLDMDGIDDDGEAASKPAQHRKPAQAAPSANGNGHKAAEPSQAKASGAIADDGWDELWNSISDYSAAKQWAWQSGKFAAEKHLDNAWAKVFKTNAGHKPENVELFLQGWRTYVNAHELAEAEAQAA